MSEKINSEPIKAFLPIFFDYFLCIHMRAAINNVISTKFILMGCILRPFMPKFTKTDPEWTAALLTSSEEVSSSPFYILGPRPEDRSEQWGRLAGEQGGWVRLQRGNPQGPGPVRVIIDPRYGGNVVNVFRNSGSRTSSLSLRERRADKVGTTVPSYNNI